MLYVLLSVGAAHSDFFGEAPRACGSDRNIGEARLGHLDADHLARIALGIDLNVDRDRRAADMRDRRVEAHHVAHQHRLLEHERIHGDGGHASACPPGSRYGAGDVDLRHHPAAEDVSVLIGIRRHRHNT